MTLEENPGILPRLRGQANEKTFYSGSLKIRPTRKAKSQSFVAVAVNQETSKLFSDTFVYNNTTQYNTTSTIAKQTFV